MNVGAAMETCMDGDDDYGNDKPQNHTEHFTDKWLTPLTKIEKYVLKCSGVLDCRFFLLFIIHLWV